MPKRIHKVVLDSNKSTPLFEINKLDSLHLEVEVTEVETLENAEVELFFKKSDGTLVSEIISEKEQNILKIDVKNGALDVPGIVVGQAKITEEDGNISSHMFKFNIKNSITSDDAIVNEIGIGAIEELKEKINNAQIDPEVLKNKIEETINNGDLDVVSKEELKQVNSQLDETTKSIENISARTGEWKEFDKGYITIVFDDGRNDLETVFNLFKSKNIPLTSACIGNKMDYHRKLLHEIENNGGEVMAHGLNSITTTDGSLNASKIEYEIRESRVIAQRLGLDVRGWRRVGGNDYVNGNDNGLSREFICKYYQYANSVTSDDLSDFYSVPNFSIATLSLDQIKEKIDNAISNKEWLVLYAHTLDGTEDGVDTTKVTAILDYINSTSIIPTTHKAMFEKFAKNGIKQNLEFIRNSVVDAGKNSYENLRDNYACFGLTADYSLTTNTLSTIKLDKTVYTSSTVAHLNSDGNIVIDKEGWYRIDFLGSYRSPTTDYYGLYKHLIEGTNIYYLTGTFGVDKKHLNIPEIGIKYLRVNDVLKFNVQFSNVTEAAPIYINKNTNIFITML